MERVSGDHGTIASSTNSCGTAFRCLMAKGLSCSEEALSRLRFVMGGRPPRFYLRTGEGLVFAGQATLSPYLHFVAGHVELGQLCSAPSDFYPTSCRIAVIRRRLVTGFSKNRLAPASRQRLWWVNPSSPVRTMTGTSTSLGNALKVCMTK
jgi:hypothetical protein